MTPYGYDRPLETFGKPFITEVKPGKKFIKRVEKDIPLDSNNLSIALKLYNNLNELVELGKVLRIHVPGDSDRFDKILVKHSHFFCERCKSIIDISEININNIINEIEINNNIKVLSNQISLYGICSKCQEKK